MDAFLAVVSKREVREFDGRPLPDDATRRILEAGRLAGNARNRQARRFVVLRARATVERAARVVHSPDTLLGAALVVAIVTRGGRGPFDAGRAAQNMMIAAWNDGIGSAPAGVADADAFREAIGHGPDEQVPIVLGFGFPARPYDAERRSAQEWIERADRLPFDEIVEER